MARRGIAARTEGRERREGFPELVTFQADVPAEPGRGLPVSRRRSRSSRAALSRLSMTMTSSGEIKASIFRSSPLSESATTGAGRSGELPT